ncbi:MAG TPA: GNAT family N-acetyltransferase [Candidatus Methanofastidiosa archaeon]|nr:GNAT family N-acetyltransferase [Candidatus Methanofastidiosa archaeon]
MRDRSHLDAGDVSLRRFSESDYPDLLDLYNSIYPYVVKTLEEQRHMDSIGFSSASLHRWVAEVDGEIVASCQYQNDLWDYHPKRFDFSIKVMPSCQGQGIGSLLYDFIMEKVSALGAQSVFSWFVDSDPRNARFLSTRGFTEARRNVFFKIDLTKWHHDESLDRTGELAGKGILIMTLKEFMEGDDWEERLYDLDREVAFDTPGVTSVPAFEIWKKEIFDSENLVPDGYFLAVKGDMAVGTTNVFRREANNALEIGFTAVRREYRGMGIATTLKLRSMLSASDLGARYLITDNEENNKAIVSLNRRLGFRRVTDWVKYEKGL